MGLPYPFKGKLGILYENVDNNPEIYILFIGCNHCRKELRMSKGSEGSWKDDTHWGKVQSNESQTNYYVGGNESEGKHCHLYVENDTGRSGVVHRGECKVCEDNENSSESSSSSSSHEDKSGGK